MVRKVSKWFFPNVPWDQRERRIKNLVLVVLVSTLMGIAIVLIALKKGI